MRSTKVIQKELNEIEAVLQSIQSHKHRLKSELAYALCPFPVGDKLSITDNTYTNAEGYVTRIEYSDKENWIAVVQIKDMNKVSLLKESTYKHFLKRSKK